MFTRLLIILIICFISNMLPAQPRELIIQGVSPDLYVIHTVQPKENWYSVGRLYNISPKEIAPYNGVTIDKSLSIGEQLKVPLTASNFAQNGSSAADETLVPVFHVIQEKEWMFRISTNYNKVPVETLEKWNNINKDQAKAGMKLVVGYLKVKKEQSALAAAGTAPVQTHSAPPVIVPPATPPVVRVEEKKMEPVITVQEKKEEKKEEPVVTIQEKKEEKKIEPQEVKTVTEKKAEVNKPVSEPVPVSSKPGGYFSQMYEENGKSSTGSSGIFKSASGWQDAKYYALMNNVAVGSIVKVTNPANNKIVFAKVLGQLPEMKESAGLAIRISDAAAADLGVSAAKFPVEIRY